jgi:hypothetical protein
MNPKNQLDGLGGNGRVILKEMIVKKDVIMWTGSEHGPVVGSCKDRNQFSYSIKCRGFLPSLCFMDTTTVNENKAVKVYSSVSQTEVSGPLVVIGGPPHGQ